MMRRLGLFFFLMPLLTACGGGGGVVNTEGSTSMADLLAVLQESFREREPEITVNYSGTGSGAGIEMVLAGACDVGLSSRPLKESETAQGAVAQVAALDGVAVVVNPDNPVSDLSPEELAAVFTGEVTDWGVLGGVPGPIAVYGREAGSGTRDAFEESVGVSGRCAYTNEYGSSGDVVGGVASNPGAIGYTSLSAAGAGVRALTVGGAACTPENIRDGSYAIQRPFLLVTKAGAALSPETEAFLAYARSGEAAAYIELAGVVAP